MVNQSETTPIPLEGRGFKALDTGDYKPGEYRQLSNVEILEGRLVGRRDIRSCTASKSSGSTETDALREDDSHNLGVMGYLDKWTIYSGRERNSGIAFQTAVSSEGTVKMLNLASNNISGSSFRQMQGFFKYNFINYWIMLYLTPTEVGVRLYYANETENDYPSDYTNGGLTNIGTQVSIPKTDSAYRDFKFNNFFLFKDRLWICTSKGMYFSKATDPTKFSVSDDGGFFLFPDTRVNYAVSFKDTIYVFTDSEVHTITYSKSPNEDATKKVVSSGTGGQHACVFRGTVYFINKEAIFSLNNNFAEKVIDNKFDTGDNNYDIQTLTPWREYLIVNSSYAFSPWGLTKDMGSGVIYNIATNATFAFKTGLVPVDSTANKFYSTTYTEYIAGSFGNIGYKQNGNTHSSNGPMISYCNTTPYSVTAETSYTFYSDMSAYSSFNDSIFTGLSPDRINRKLASFVIYLNASNVEISREYFTLIEQTKGLRNDRFPVMAEYRTKFNTPSGCTKIVCGMAVYTTGGGTTVAGENYGFSRRMLHLSHDTIRFFYGSTSDSDAIYSYVIPNSQSTSASIRINSAVTYHNYLVPYFDERTSTEKGNSLHVNTVFINMDNSSVHSVEYKNKSLDVYKGNENTSYYNYARVDGDSISIISTNPNVDQNNDSSLLFGINSIFEYSVGADVDRYTISGSYYSYMKTSHSDLPFDSVLYKDPSLSYSRLSKVRQRPRYIIEFDSLNPEDTEYLTKKFRNLNIMGKFPSNRLNLAVAYNDRSYLPSTEISDEVIEGNKRPHFPHRIGLNQRGHSMSIILFTQEDDPIKGDIFNNVEFTYDKLEISNIQLLWSSTLRSTTKRSNY